MSRTRIMAVLLILLCGALVYAWVATPKQKRIEPWQGTMQSVKQSPSMQTLVAAKIDDLDFTQGRKTQFTPPEKSLFAPLYFPAKPVKVYQLSPPRINKPGPVTPVFKTKLVAATEKGPDPIQPLNVLGFLNKGGKYRVFLASAHGEVYILKPGDNFSSGLSVVEITPERITIARKTTGQRVVLKIGKAKSQRLPSVSFNPDRPKFKVPAKPIQNSKVIKKLPAENPFSNAIKRLGK